MHEREKLSFSKLYNKRLGLRPEALTSCGRSTIMLGISICRESNEPTLGEAPCGKILQHLSQRFLTGMNNASKTPHTEYDVSYYRSLIFESLGRLRWNYKNQAYYH